MHPERSAAAQLLDVCRHAFAYAGNLQQLLRLIEQGGRLLRESFEGLSGAAIRADTEGVVAVDLHQIGGFVEDVGDGLVVHAKCPSEIVTCGAVLRRGVGSSPEGPLRTHAAAFRRNPSPFRNAGSRGSHRNAWPAVAVRWCRE